MSEIYDRTELLLGKDAVEKLHKKRVAVFGIGGVGGFAAEALARTGIGHLTLIDKDEVSVSNINRQIIATSENIGEPKVEAAKKRIHSINPEVDVKAVFEFFNESTAEKVNFLEDVDYIIDAIDTVSSKLLLIEEAKKLGIPIISCMGAGNKLDPTAFRVADIYETSVCPLAKVMRRELKARNVDSLKVVYSVEPPRTPAEKRTDGHGKVTVGSIASVVAVPGLILANEAIKDLIK